jgi:hypothetical protein
MLERILMAALCAASGVSPAAAQSEGWGRGDPVPESMPVASKPSGNPLYDMPAGQTLVSAFGERPAFSPDGTKIAFMGKSYGDAFEYDLKTGKTRNLTNHAPNKGFLRVQYMADGNFLLLGPRFPAATREETRFSRVEMFWMDAAASRPPVPLGKTVFEGIAASPDSNLIAWSEISIDPAKKGPASTRLFTARVIAGDGSVRLEGVTKVAETTECFVEAQDFLPGNKAITAPCYTYGSAERAAVISIDIASGKTTRYPTPGHQYSEVEGLFPDGKRTLVECADDRRKGMDLCVLDLDTAHPRYTRMTNIVRFGPYKYGNPVVRPDGRMIAAQIGPADVIDAGVGDGIVIIDLKPGF